METHIFVGKSYRLFQGQETRQINGVTCREAVPEAWYFEPEDYAGDVLYSDGYAYREEALEALTRDAENN